MNDILNPVCKLAPKLQHENSALCDIPDLLAMVKNRFREITKDKQYLKDAAECVRDCSIALMGSSKMTDREIHTKLVLPYIKVLSDSIDQRFNDLTTKMCYASSIFDQKNIQNDDSMYGKARLLI